MSSTKTKGKKTSSPRSTSKKPQKKAKAGNRKAKKWSDKPRNKMVGFWFDEAELKAFDSALVKANYVKPNGKANRADYLKDMAKALVQKFGTVADKNVFGEKPAKAKSAKKSTKKKPAKKTEKQLATTGAGAVG